MCSGQCEARRAVVKRSAIPAFCGVAGGAILESKCRARSGVHRIGGLLPPGQMTTGSSASRRSDLQIVIVVDVAGSAGYVRVSVRQQESGGRVIEIRTAPAHGGVAIRAVVQGERRSGRNVRRVSGRLPSGHVAAHGTAGIRSNLQIVVVVDVARSARNASVSVGEQEPGGAVIEFSVQPGIEGMAGFASCRELGTRVVGIRGLLIILQMARNALGGKPLILRHRRAFVAIFALHRCVRAQ
jgi:hypothetical protein